MKGKRKILLKSFISTIIVSIIYFIMLKYKNINRDILTFSVVPLSYFIFSYLGNLFLINSGYSSIKIIPMSLMQYKSYGS